MKSAQPDTSRRTHVDRSNTSSDEKKRRLAYVARPDPRTLHSRMKFVFIVNPKAGGLAAARRRRRLLDALTSSELEFVIKLTEHRHHALELARAAADEGSAAIAVGGDGTAHEVASGVIESGRGTPFGVLPCGTGNDFAKMLVLPESPVKTADFLTKGSVERVDYGVIEWDGPDGPGRATFINIGGTGFDAKVAAAAPAFKYLSGTPRYLASVLRTLNGWRAPNATVTLEVGGTVVYSLEGPLFMALAGNGRCSGGGFYLTPAALIDDGRLDGCIIRNAPVPRILTLIPRALKGKHVGQPEVALHKMDRMLVTTSEPLPVQADGEILAERATEVVVHIVPGGLNILLPVKG